MPKLSLMFEGKTVAEVPIGSRAVTIGRSPDNDIPVDNLAVSNHHARVYYEGSRLVVEDLNLPYPGRAPAVPPRRLCIDYALGNWTQEARLVGQPHRQLALR